MKKFTIYMIYHSHIDIGYTERQEKIAKYQAEFTKQAINNVLNNPEFKYTAEGFWAIEQYLKKYPNGKQNLIAAIKTKRFEMTACYFHLAELLNMKNLNNSLDYAYNFSINNNLEPTKVAMACDINGFSWGFADALYDHGVKYLMTNINTHHGGAPFSKPLVPFYWETPEKRKILVWNGLTYHKCNLLGLIPGSTPMGDPGVPGLEPTEAGFVDVKEPDDYANERIFNMVKGLINQGYEYDFLPLCGSGLYTDNSPVGIEHVELINKWNKMYGDQIEIKLSTVEEFFKHLETVKDIPTFKGDWTDWWTDGVLSTPNETKLFRNAQRNQKLIDLLDPKGNCYKKEDAEKLINKLILYSEHTWGHSASWSDPYRLLVQQLDMRKANLAIEADILSSTILDDVCEAIGEGEFTHRRPYEYLIINPHNYEISTICYLPTDFWEEGYFVNKKIIVVDESENEYVTQRTYTLRGAFVSVVVHMNPNEHKILKMKVCDIPVEKEEANFGIFNGKYYKIEYDNNGINSIISNGVETLFEGKTKLGFPIYQVFPNGKRQDAAGFGYSSRKIPGCLYHFPTNVSLIVKECGPLFTILRYTFDLVGNKKSAVEFKLFKDLNKIEITNEFAHNLEVDPEGLYVEFPFVLPNGKWILDKPGAFIYPGTQLPDTCCDYYAVDRGVILEGNNSAIAINTLDTPMISIGDIKLWNFTTQIENKGSMFSWILNNKWETNFRTDCSGYIESRYIVSFSNNLKDSKQELETHDVSIVTLRK